MAGTIGRTPLCRSREYHAKELRLYLSREEMCLSGDELSREVTDWHFRDTAL